MTTLQKAITEVPSQTHLNQEMRKNSLHLYLLQTKTKTIIRGIKNSRLQVAPFQMKKKTLV